MKKGFVTMIVAVMGVAAGVALSMKPWHVYAQQKRSSEQQLAQLHHLEQEHVLDLEKGAKLSTSVGREQLAREQGWRRKGEVPSGD